MIQFRTCFVSLFTLVLFNACTQSPQSKIKEGEMSFPFYMNPFLPSGNLDSQKAAAIFGFSTEATPGTYARGNCTGCHSQFAEMDGIQSLMESTYRLVNCFNTNPDNRSSARDALVCLANLRDGNLGPISDGSAGLEPISDEVLSKALLGLKPENLGIFTAAANHSVMAKIFEKAELAGMYSDWKKKLAMPYGGRFLPDQDAETLVQWFVEGLTGIEKYVQHNGPEVCRSEGDTFIGSKIREHVARMSLEGESWEFVNLARGLTMFGCSDSDKNFCFQQKKDEQDIFPSQNEWLQPDVAGQIRKLHTFQAPTDFWIRSSADGRFVAAGGSPSIVVDLLDKLRGKDPKVINVKADFDPSFAPDNQSFMFQGESGSRVCLQSILEDADTVTIDFMNTGCSTSDLEVGLYQGLGSNLSNGDIVTIAGNFQSDAGQSVYQDITPLFSEKSDLTISTIRRSDATSFEKVSAYTIPTAYHAGWMASPSQLMAAAVVSASTDQKARHGGYRLIMLDEELRTKAQLPVWDDSASASLCVGSGEKPTFSFDERYLVYYAYDQHANKVKAAESSSNLFVIDLLGDGKPVQITRMPKGSYAQFPHFRSDGWLYFSVYESKTDIRTVMATDAVFKMVP